MIITILASAVIINVIISGSIIATISLLTEAIMLVVAEIILLTISVSTDMNVVSISSIDCATWLLVASLIII
jgi:hypothetical protein